MLFGLTDCFLYLTRGSSFSHFYTHARA